MMYTDYLWDLQKPVEQLLQECLELGVIRRKYPASSPDDRSKGTVYIS